MGSSVVMSSAGSSVVASSVGSPVVVSSAGVSVAGVSAVVSSAAATSSPVVPGSAAAAVTEAVARVRPAIVAPVLDARVEAMVCSTDMGWWLREGDEWEMTLHTSQRHVGA